MNMQEQISKEVTDHLRYVEECHKAYLEALQKDAQR